MSKMDEVRAGLLMLKGMVADLSSEEQAEVQTCNEEIRAVVEKHGDVGNISLSMVGMEETVKAMG